MVLLSRKLTNHTHRDVENTRNVLLGWQLRQPVKEERMLKLSWLAWLLLLAWLSNAVAPYELARLLSYGQGRVRRVPLSTLLGN